MGTSTKILQTEFAADYKSAKMSLSTYGRDVYDQGGNSDYERLVPTERDDDFFLSAWETAVRNVSDILRDQLLDFSLSDGVASYTVRTYDVVYDGGLLSGDVSDYVRAYLCSRWYEQKSPDLLEQYGKALSASEGSLRLKASYKPRPKFKYFNR